MTTSEDTEAPAKPERVPRRLRKRSLWRRLGMNSILFAITFTALLFMCFYVALGRPLSAPDWLYARLEARAADVLPDARLSFGDVEFVMHQGWQPRIRLWDVTVSSNDGREIVSFSQLESAFDFEMLLQGKLRPVEVDLVGVFATLKRSETGEFNLSGGVDLSAPAQQAPNFPALIAELDRLLTRDPLQALRSVDLQALTLRYEDARVARAWTIDGGRVRLNRDASELTLSADVALLSGTAGIATVEANYAGTIGSNAAEFGITFSEVEARDIAAQSPAFAWLEALRAPISGSMRSGLDAAGALEPLNATLSIGKGVLQPTEATEPVPFEAARTYFTFDANDQSIHFDDISVQSEWVTGRGEGTAWLSGLEEGRLDDLVAQLSLSKLSFNPAEAYPEAVELDRADADLRLTLDPFRIELGQGHLQLGQRDMIVRGDLLAEPDGWRFAMDAQADALTLGEVARYWPESLATKSRKWVVANIPQANLKAVDVALRGGTGSAVRSFFSFDFAQASIRYLKTMPPITRAFGRASLLDGRLVVAVDGGLVIAPQGGTIDLSGSSFIVENTRIKENTPAKVELSTKSSVTSVLSLLDQAPLNIMTKAGLDPNLALGLARLDGSLRFPLRKNLKTKDIDFAVSGEVQNVSSDVLIPGRNLAAPFLVVEATPVEVVVGGPGTLDGVGFEAAWRQEIGSGKPSLVNGTLSLSEATMRTFGIAMAPGTVRGAGSGEFTVRLPRGEPPQFAFQSNLAGIGLSIPSLEWSLPQDQTATLDVAGVLGKTPRVDRLSLDAPGLSTTGSVRLAEGGFLQEARFENMEVGDWLNAPVSLIGRGPDVAPDIAVDGGSIDLRRATFGSGSGTAQSGQMRLRLDRLRISDTIALTDFDGRFSVRGGLDGTFRARVNGGPEIEGQVVPQNGRSAVRILSSNAGGVIAATGLMQQARGGDMSLTLIPVGSDGIFDGSLKVTGTRVKNAPVMADLLSAISIVGLVEQLSGDGIAFNQIEADFRMTPSRVVLRRASAVGPSMGISMDGVYTTRNKALQMQGVISPVYFLNGIGSIFTRRGEGLIGFNYKLGGTADVPKVQVNPLSALTPGFFRDIFRSSPPEIPDDGVAPGKTPEALAPEPKRKRERPKVLSGADR